MGWPGLAFFEGVCVFIHTTHYHLRRDYQVQVELTLKFPCSGVPGLPIYTRVGVTPFKFTFIGPDKV